MTTPGVHDFVMVLDQLKPNFNIGKTLRSVEAFGGHEVRLVGVDFFNPYPAKGAFLHVPVKFDRTFGDTYQDLTLREYTLLAMDPTATDSLQTLALPRRSAFIIGHEYKGLSFDLAHFPKVKRIRIDQFGQTQSLNASVAASVAMYEYTRQHALKSVRVGPTPKISFRKLSEEDSETLRSLMCRIPSYLSCAEESDTPKSILQGDCQVIRAENHTVGLVHFEVCQQSSTATIRSIHLLKEFQRAGFDRLAFQQLESQLKLQGIKTILVGINPLTEARISWEKLGFSPNGKIGIQKGIKAKYRVVQLEKTLA